MHATNLARPYTYAPARGGHAPGHIREAKLQRTAIHEAGHAVIGRVLGLACGDVTIIADHNSNGHAILATPYAIEQAWEDCGKYRDIASAFRGRILAYMAGREAEEVILGRDGGGDGDDQFQIALMLEEVTIAEEAERLAHRLRRHARSLVKRHRQPIERVAAALLVHRKLTDDGVRRAAFAD